MPAETRRFYAIKSINPAFYGEKYVFHRANAQHMAGLALWQQGNGPIQNMAHFFFAKRAANAKTVKGQIGNKFCGFFTQIAKFRALHNSKQSLVFAFVRRK